MRAFLDCRSMLYYSVSKLCGDTGSEMRTGSGNYVVLEVFMSKKPIRLAVRFVAIVVLGEVV